MNLLKLLLCAPFFFLHNVCAQVMFTELPENFQMIVRNNDRSGTFLVSGANSYKKYPIVKSRLVRASDSLLISEKTSAPGSNGRFSMELGIPASLEEYNLTIYAANMFSDTLIKTVDHLVCGDYFIIAGQSNALAADNYSDSLFRDNWLRGIGTHDNPDLGDCGRQSLNYGRSSCFWLGDGYTGTWGLKLQHDLAAYTGFGSCFVNGARGGSSIIENMASHTPSNPDLLDSCLVYDRLFKKIITHGVNTAVRGIFWYQGETDGGRLSQDSACAYMDWFDKLYASWKADYPNLEKIILLQINTGCNVYHMAQLRDIQRRIAGRYADIVLMSTFSSENDDRTNDGCHYTFKGYCRLADKLLPLVKKYFYNEPFSDAVIVPPSVTKAYRAGTTQICIEFDKAIALEQEKRYPYEVAQLKDYFYGEDLERLSLLSVDAGENKLYLNFEQGAILPEYIAYLPNETTLAGNLYTGPFIVNRLNPDLKALSFYNYPVTPYYTDDQPANDTNPCKKVAFTAPGFIVYPNPAEDVVTLVFAGRLLNTRVSLIDAQGRTLLVQNSRGIALTFDLHAYKSGIYILKMENELGTVLKKIAIRTGP